MATEIALRHKKITFCDGSYPVAKSSVLFDRFSCSATKVLIAKNVLLFILSFLATKNIDHLKFDCFLATNNLVTESLTFFATKL